MAQCKSICGWLWVLALLAGIARPAGAEFLASPMELYLSDGPGARGAASILLTNTGDAPVTLKLYMGDSRMLPTGGEEEVALGSPRRSLSSWVRLDQQVLDLEAGQSRRVTVDLDVPADAEGSYWSKLYIEETSAPRSAAAEQEGRRYNVFMRQRLGVRIFEDVAGTGKLEAVVEHVGVQESTTGRPSAQVTVSNPGSLIARCHGRIELHNERGEIVEELSLGTHGEFWVFPESRRVLTAQPTTPLAPGTYTALAVVDFGGEYLVAGDAVLTVAARDPTLDPADSEREP
jgi:hypothetical protein